MHICHSQNSIDELVIYHRNILFIQEAKRKKNIVKIHVYVWKEIKTFHFDVDDFLNEKVFFSLSLFFNIDNDMEWKAVEYSNYVASLTTLSWRIYFCEIKVFKVNFSALMKTLFVNLHQIGTKKGENFFAQHENKKLSLKFFLRERMRNKISW